MTATQPKQLAWDVTDPATHSGGVYKAATAEGAARRAVKSVWLKGAKTLVVKSFAGQAAPSRQTFDVETL